MSAVAEAAWELWGRTQSTMRAKFSRAPITPYSAGRECAWFVVQRVAKAWCLGAGGREPHRTTIALETFAAWALEEFGEERKGFSKSSFRRAILRLEKCGWLVVERRGRKKRRIDYHCLVLAPGNVLAKILGIARSILARPEFRSVRELVKDVLWHARRYTNHLRNEQLSGERVRTPVLGDSSRAPSAQVGVGLSADQLLTPGSRLFRMLHGAALEAVAPSPELFERGESSAGDEKPPS